MLSNNMDKLAMMCRICLSNDIPVRMILNKCLQETYEVLTKLPILSVGLNISNSALCVGFSHKQTQQARLEKRAATLNAWLFVTDNSRPMLVCYICYARLHNSYKLAKSCLRSEALFQRMLNTGACLTNMQQLPTSKTFCMTEVVHVSCPADMEELSSVCGVEVKEEITEDVAHCQGTLEANAMCYLEPRYNLEFKPIIQLEPYHFINSVKTEPVVECDDVTAPSLSLHADVEQPSYLIPFDAVNIQVQRCDVTTEEEMKISVAASSDNLRNDPTQYQALYGSAGGDVTFGASGQSFTSSINSTYEMEIMPQTNDLLSPQATTHGATPTSHKSFQCNTCNKSFSSKYNLDRHSRNHTSTDKSFECNVCKKRIRQKVNFLRHVRIHTSEKCFECDVCNKRFKENSSLVRHARMHSNNAGDKRKLLQCDVCNKHFQDNSKLLRHARTHTGEKPFECDVCYKRYSRSSTLAAHYSTHTGDKTFACNVCNKRFSSSIYLVRHSRCHSEDKAYKCDVCKKCFRDSDKLAAHLRTHTGEKPFECHVCLKRYSSRRHLADHITIHNSDNSFECEVCGKCLTNKYNLERHARSHNDLKTFECDVCKKSFRQNYQLARHIRRHTGESSVECGVCGKRCSTKYGLAVHTRCHTGERPFECDACAKRFRLKNHLIAHLRVHERRQRHLEAHVPPVPETERH